MPSTILGASVLGFIPTNRYPAGFVLLEDWDDDEGRIVWRVAFVEDITFPVLIKVGTFTELEVARQSLIERAGNA